jgi:predicted small secreted protein
MNKLISVVVVSVLSVSLLVLSGCNTVKGAGRDISKTGKAIEKASR